MFFTSTEQLAISEVAKDRDGFLVELQYGTV